MAKFAISDEMKNEQYLQLRRTRIPRLVVLILVICLMEFLRNYEPFRSNFWVVILISIVAGIIGWFFILWVDGKKQGTANSKGLTTPK
jgi:NAD/NADP transhydrogenase beta subunit